MKNTELRAGESRRSRRLVLNSLATLVVGAALVIVINQGVAEKQSDAFATRNDEKFTRPDAELAEELLERVRGANAVLCSSIDRMFDTGRWGGTVALALENTTSQADAELINWIGKRHLDREALASARRGMVSEDVCTRAVASRIAGKVAVTALHAELRSELATASLDTRMAALLAIGHAAQPESVPLLIDLLQNDRAPEIRRVAAWALGRIED